VSAPEQWVAATVVLAFTGPVARAQTPQQLIASRYDVDPQHSSVAFTARILGAVKVRGRFRDYQASIVYDPAAPERSSVTAVIDANSIDTDMDFRDRHLRTPDFLDVERFPSIRFQSQSVQRRGSTLVATGPLTLHGVTRVIELPIIVVLAPDTSAASHTVRTAFEASVRLSRRDFGIAGSNRFNPSFHPDAMLLSDRVDVELALYAVQPGYGDRTFAGRTPPSVADTVSRALHAHGIDAALRVYRAIRADSTANFSVTAGQLDALGHKLMDRSRWREAIALLRVNEEYFPSVNGVSQSLGDAYARAGDVGAALAAYQRALAVDSTNTSAIEMVRHLNPAATRPLR
jgi:polyisoprenoid-binding protein YceI